MSMYDMIFGHNPIAGAILATLELEPGDFGRLRDVFVMSREIVVYTRCGGGNRPAYKKVFEKMSEHPDFLREEDDGHDNTYCTFFFRLPERWREDLMEFNIDLPWDPGKRWQDAIKAISERSGAPESPRPVSDTGVDGKKGMI